MVVDHKRIPGGQGTQILNEESEDFYLFLFVKNP